MFRKYVIPLIALAGVAFAIFTAFWRNKLPPAPPVSRCRSRLIQRLWPAQDSSRPARKIFRSAHTSLGSFLKSSSRSVAT